MLILKRLKYKNFESLAVKLGYTDKNIIVIVNIDDVGMHKDETEASFKALKYGLVKSGSIMVPCPNFDHAIKLWKKNPEISIGVHLTLTCEWGEKYSWSPVLPKNEVPSLYNINNIMWPSVKDLLENANRIEIIKELEAQITKIINTGLKPSHLDHHMDFYYHQDLFCDVMGLSIKYNLPMRVWRRRKYRLPLIKNNLKTLRKRGFIFPDTQMGIYNLDGKNKTLEFRKGKYYDHLRLLKPGLHNIKLHIAFNTDELQNIMGRHSSSIRQIDYDVWTSEETRKLAEQLGIIFIGFRPLQKLQGSQMNKLHTSYEPIE